MRSTAGALLQPLHWLACSPICTACSFTPVQENEPDIFHAIKFGCILENVVFDEEVRGG